MDKEIYDLSEHLGMALKSRGMLLATAESCTGGWISQAVTMVPGSSKWFECGFVTYTNRSKHEMLGVRSTTLQADGAVAEMVVREMAEGALQRSGAHCSVAVSGVAGPDGGSPAKPVGTVWLAIADQQGETSPSAAKQLRKMVSALLRNAKNNNLILESFEILTSTRRY